MNVLMIYLTYPPEVGAGSNRVTAFKKYLEAKGHTAHVLTKQIPKGFKAKFLRRGPMQDFNMKSDEKNVHRCLGFGLPANYFPPAVGFVPGMFLQGIKQKFDIIYASSPSIGCAIAGFFLKKATKKPLVLEFRDPWVRSQKCTKKQFVDKYSIRGRVFKTLEKALLDNADALVFTNSGVREEMLAAHEKLPNCMSSIVYNAVNPVNRTATPRSLAIGYTGVLFLARGLSVLLKAFRLIINKFPRAKLYLIGDGPDKKKIERLVRKLDLTHSVIFTGTKTGKEFENLLNKINIFYTGLSDVFEYKYALSSKVFQYMAAGKPCVVSGPKDGDLRNIVRKEQCGLDVDEDEEAIANAILTVWADKSLLNTYGKNSLVAFEREYNWSVQAKKMENMLLSVVSKKESSHFN